MKLNKEKIRCISVAAWYEIGDRTHVEIAREMRLRGDKLKQPLPEKM